MAVSRTMLVDFGDLPSLVAAGLEQEPESLILGHVITGDPSVGDRRRIIQQHARTLSVSRVVQLNAGGQVGNPAAFVRPSAVITAAAAAALDLGCRRVVFPFTSGGDGAAMGLGVERAYLAAILVGLDTGENQSIDIVQPVLDITDAEILDLADDLGLPLNQFWPCDAPAKDGRVDSASDTTWAPSPSPCGQCAGCTRWIAAFAACGIRWPWGCARRQGELTPSR